ncbi:MAG: hypothetical protein KF709_14840 [Gemmatimonadaceae bacterium]|nr:hypothetical protein [Gemmatimonadaceae bacterium]
MRPLAAALVVLLLGVLPSATIHAQGWVNSIQRTDGQVGGVVGQMLIALIPPGTAGRCSGCKHISKFEGGFADVATFFGGTSWGLQEVRFAHDFRLDSTLTVVAPNGSGGEVFRQVSEFNLRPITRAEVRITVSATNPITGEKRVQTDAFSIEQGRSTRTQTITFGESAWLQLFSRWNTNKVPLKVQGDSLKVRVESIEWVRATTTNLQSIDNRVGLELQRLAQQQQQQQQQSGASASATTAGSAGATSGTGARSAGSAASGAAAGSASAASGSAAASRSAPSAPAAPAVARPTYDAAATQRWQAQYDAQTKQWNDQFTADIARNERNWRQKQASYQAAGEKLGREIAAVLEARERQAKIRAINAEAGRIARVAASTERLLRDDIADLQREEQRLHEVIRRHPGLPTPVVTGIQQATTRLREAQRAKLATITKLYEEVDEIFVDAEEAYDGDLTKAYTGGLDDFRRANAGAINSYPELGASSLSLVRSTAMPAAQRAAVAEDLTPVLLDNAKFLCSGSAARSIGNEYSAIGGRSPSVLEVVAEAQSVSAYQSALGNVTTQLRAATESMGRRYAKLTVRSQPNGTLFTRQQILNRAAVRGQSANSVRLVGVTGVVDVQQELDSLVKALLPSRPALRHFDCEQLEDPMRRVNLSLNEQFVYLRPGQQTLTLRRLYRSPDPLELRTVAMEPGKEFSLTLSSYERNFGVDRHLLALGTPDFRNDLVMLSNPVLRNYHVDLHPSGYVEANTEVLAFRRGDLSDYWSRKMIPTLGMVGLTLGVGAGSRTVDGLDERNTVLGWRMLDLSAGLMKRLSDNVVISPALTLNTFNARFVTFDVSGVGTGGAFNDRGSVVIFDGLTPTASFEVHFLKGTRRLSLRYGYSFYWVSDDPEYDKNASDYDDLTQASFETFSRDRMAHTIGLSIKF